MYIEFSDLLEVEFGYDPINLPEGQMLGVDNTHITGVEANVTAPVNAPYTVSETGIE